MSAKEHIPLVKSFEETVELWPALSATQKLGAATACIVTVAGPASRLFLEVGRDTAAPPATFEKLANIAIDLRDGLDGKLARATGGITPLGKELDPLADKIDFLIQEAAQYRRGELPAVHLGLRFARDALVTILRADVMAKSNGQANVSAGWHGKVSTVLRQVSLRATNIHADKSLPRVRTIHQTAATGLLLATGAMNIKQLLNERQNYP